MVKVGIRGIKDDRRKACNGRETWDVDLDRGRGPGGMGEGEKDGKVIGDVAIEK